MPSSRLLSVHGRAVFPTRSVRRHSRLIPLPAERKQTVKLRRSFACGPEHRVWFV